MQNVIHIIVVAIWPMDNWHMLLFLGYHLLLLIGLVAEVV